MKYFTALTSIVLMAMVMLVNSAWATNGNGHSGYNGGYAHHDNHSGRYDSHKNSWEWRGAHQGCHIKGKHYHKHHGGHNHPAEQLDCSRAKASPKVLWPANHRFTSVDITGMTTSTGNAPEVTIQCVFQDEPLNGISDGNTDIDAKLLSNGQLKLRKERAGRHSGYGNGRVYHIDFEATDQAAGETCHGSVAVEVPHRWWGKAKDEGKLYVSLDNGYNCGGNSNQPPVITSNPITSTSELVSYEYTVVAEDPEGDALGYLLTDAPSGMTVSGDGVIAWQPAQGSAGSYSVTVQVDDGQGGSDEQSYTLVVSPRLNTAPVFTSLPTLNATEEQSYQYQLEAVDSENDAFGFSLGVAPVGMAITLDGLLQWTPTNGQAGQHNVTVEAIDELGAMAEQSFVITVAPKPNNIPDILSTPIVTVSENALYQYTVLAIDPEGTALAYSLAEAPNGMTLAANVLEWSPTFDDAGEYAVEITVTDEEGGVATQSYLLTVADVNRAPVFVSVPVLIVAENIAYEYLPEATDDDDGDSVTYTLTVAPNGMALNVDGVIEWMPSYDAAGTYTVEITADDSRGGTAIEQYLLTVTNTNRDPQIISAPLEVATENTLYSYQVEANDDDDESLVYSLLVSPVQMSINTLGLIEWLPDFTTAGDVTVEVAVSDGSSEITQSFVITVVNVNQPPVALSKTIGIIEDTLAVIVLDASDDDGDTLTYSIITMPVNGVAVLNNNQVTYTPAANFNGIDSFVFMANDGTEDSALATINITIAAVNDAPVLNLSPALAGQENTLYIASVGASDSDGDLLMFSLQASPAGMQIDAATGAINWQPSFDQAGDHTVTVVVTDTSGLTDSSSFTITIANTNRAPIANDLAAQTDKDVSVAVTLQGLDEDADALTYSISTQPSSGTVLLQGSVASYTPASGFVGSDSFSYVVNDGVVGSTSATVSITVSAPNNSPIITSAPENVGLEGEDYNYMVAANDPDGDIITFALAESPSGMVIDGLTGVIEWVEPVAGEHAIRVVVSDTFGLAVEQAYTLFVAPPLPPVTSSGTDFWMMFNSNLASQADRQGVVHTPFHRLYIASKTDADILIEVPGKGFTQNYTVNADQVLTIDLTSLNLVADIPSSEPKSTAVHIVSTEPVVSYLINDLQHTTDASIILPTNALGKEYSVSSFVAHRQNSNGSFFGVVATENNTTITIDPSQRYTVDGVVRPKGIPYDVSLQRGETFEVVDTTNSFRIRDWSDSSLFVDFSGTTVSSSQPIAVFSGNRCSTAGIWSECDHMVEQQIPLESLGSRYMTIPLAQRFLGDTFRVYAVEDDTYVFINEKIVDYLDKGEFYETILDTPSVVESNRAIQVMQFSNSSGYDNLQQPDDQKFAGPFMLSIPAEEQFLGSYIVTTPESGYPVNFINLISQADSSHTVTVDGVVVDPSLWIPVQNTEFVGAQIPIEAGVHRAMSTEPFGLYIYGFQEDGSYGYVGGLALNANIQPEQILLSASTLNPVAGSEVCISGLLSAANAPVTQTPVEFIVSSGSLGFQTTFTDISDSSGNAEFCYTRGDADTDSIVVSTSDELSASISINWQPYTNAENLSPVIESLPPVIAVIGTTYTYQPIVRDPNGDQLSYSVISDALAEGMVFDIQTGAISWAIPTTVDRNKRYAIEIIVIDAAGAVAQQRYMIKTVLENQAPVIEHDKLLVLNENQNRVYFLSANDPNYDLSLPQSLNDELSWQLLKGGGLDDFQPDNVVDARISVNYATPYPGMPIHTNQYCRATDSYLSALELKQNWLVQSRTGQGVVGPLYDSNGDGVLNAFDRTAIIARWDQREIAAIDAATGKTIWRTTGNTRTSNASVGTLVNLFGDTDSEYVFFDNSSRKLIALKSDGMLLWETTETVADNRNQFGVVYPADLNHDGLVELLYGPSVVDPNGKILWQFELSGNSQQVGAAALGSTLAADLDQDGFDEVIYYDEVRDWQGNLLWKINQNLSGVNDTENTVNALRYSHFASGNFDDDPELELVVNAYYPNNNQGYEYRLILVDDDGTELWDQPVATTGPISIEDFNKDGVQDIYFPSTHTLYAANGTTIWSHGPVKQNVGASIADFDANGLLDILRYVDDELVVHEGASGDLVFRNFERRNGTTNARIPHVPPLFIDINNDGRGELLTVGRSDLKAYQSATGVWPAAVKNQSYLYQNIDATSANLSYNVAFNVERFGRSANIAPVDLPPESAGKLSDLVIHSVSVNPVDTGWLVEVEIVNRGLLATPNGVIVELFKNEVNSANKVGEISLSEIRGGAGAQTFTYVLDDIEDLGNHLIAQVQSNSNLNECYTANNIASATTRMVEVTDFDGLKDVEAWGVGVYGLPVSPVISSNSPPNTAQVGQLYTHQLTAQTVSLTNETRFRISNAPDGASLDTLTGVFKWVPTADQVGVNTIIITAHGLSDQTGATAVFVVIVEASSMPNLPPVITSVPVNSVPFNLSYNYVVTASDSEGEYLTFALSAAPESMTINSLTGEIRWQPNSNDIGLSSVTIEVTDEVGQTAIQSFVINVDANAAPVITSNPINTALINTLYSYQVGATDVGGDVLIYSLTQSPSGMAISNSGLITWDTSSVAVGTYAVQLAVSDGFSQATQSFDIEVIEDTGGGSSTLMLFNEPKTVAFTGQSFSFFTAGVSTEPGSVEITLISAPAGMTLTADQPSAGFYQIDWLPDEANCQHDVTLELSDGLGNIEQVTFTIDVYNAAKRLNRFQCSVDADFCATRQGE